MKNSVKRHASALTAVLACLALALVLYHSLAGGTLLQSSPYNSYALQAENWLAGRNNIENGENSHGWNWQFIRDGIINPFHRCQRY